MRRVTGDAAEELGRVVLVERLDELGQGEEPEVTLDHPPRLHGLVEERTCARSGLIGDLVRSDAERLKKGKHSRTAAGGATGCLTLTSPDALEVASGE